MVEQSTPQTAPLAAPLQAPGEHPVVDAPMPAGPPGFSERGRMRRRARFLRKARELAYRDLGGLVFNLHRFGQRNDALVIAKLSTLGLVASELEPCRGARPRRAGAAGARRRPDLERDANHQIHAALRRENPAAAERPAG